MTKEYGIKFKLKRDGRIETLWCIDQRHQEMRYNAFRAQSGYKDVKKVERNLVDRTKKKKKK